MIKEGEERIAAEAGILLRRWAVYWGELILELKGGCEKEGGIWLYGD